MNTKQRTILVALTIANLCVLCVGGIIVMTYVRSGSNDPSSERVTLTATPIVASCTEMLFGESMGDDVDVLVGQGEILHQTSSIAVRFDCAHVTPKQVTFQWYYNNSALCT